MDKQELYVRRAELIKELALVNAAIEASTDNSAVEIRLHKNIRNTPYVAVREDWSDTCLIVFADEGLTTLADNQDHGGFVSKAILATFRLEHPDLFEDHLISEVQ